MNRSTRIISWGSAILFALLIAGMTYAEQSVYFDGAFGRAKVDNAPFDIAVADNTNAARFGIGFDFGNNIAVEANYMTLGDIEDGDNSALVKGDTDGFTLAARFELPLTQTLRASAKGGLFLWQSNLDTPVGVFEDDGEDLFYGVSLDFEATRNLTLSAEWDRFEFDRGEADVIWAGLRFSF